MNIETRHITTQTPLLKDIASELRAAADTLPEWAPEDHEITCILGSLRVTTRATSGALRQAAEKYAKGFRLRGKLAAQPSSRRAKFNQAAFRNMLEDGETENALTYARLYPPQDWPPAIAAVIADLEANHEVGR